jgi:hypothetical protein
LAGAAYVPVTLRQRSAWLVFAGFMNSVTLGVCAGLITDWLGGEVVWSLTLGVAVGLLTLARWLSLSVTLNEGGVKVRNPCWTYRIAREEVIGIGGGEYWLLSLRVNCGAAEIRTSRRRKPKGPDFWTASKFMQSFAPPPPLTVQIAASVLRTRRQRERFVERFNAASAALGLVSSLNVLDLAMSPEYEKRRLDRRYEKGRF